MKLYDGSNNQVSVTAANCGSAPCARSSDWDSIYEPMYAFTDPPGLFCTARYTGHGWLQVRLWGSIPRLTCCALLRLAPFCDWC